jgi:hypothetical protein
MENEAQSNVGRFSALPRCQMRGENLSAFFAILRFRAVLEIPLPEEDLVQEVRGGGAGEELTDAGIGSGFLCGVRVRAYACMCASILCMGACGAVVDI